MTTVVEVSQQTHENSEAPLQEQELDPRYLTKEDFLLFLESSDSSLLKSYREVRQAAMLSLFRQLRLKEVEN